MNLADRIEAHEREQEALEAFLEPILHKLMSVDMPIEFARGWDLHEFDVDKENLRLTARDVRDGETKVYRVPLWAAEGDIDGWVKMQKELKAEKDAESEENRKRTELQDLEARSARLRAELQGAAT